MKAAPGKPPSEKVVRTISYVVLGAALIVLLVPIYDAATRSWAMAATGAVMGYWLRGRSVG